MINGQLSSWGEFPYKSCAPGPEPWPPRREHRSGFSPGATGPRRGPQLSRCVDLERIGHRNPGHLLSSLFLFPANGPSVFSEGRVEVPLIARHSCLVKDQMVPIASQRVRSRLLPAPTWPGDQPCCGLWPWPAHPFRVLPDSSATRQEQRLRAHIKQACRPRFESSLHPSLQDACLRPGAADGALCV